MAPVTKTERGDSPLQLKFELQGNFFLGNHLTSQAAILTTHIAQTIAIAI